jgi:hypothetical protein
MAPHHERVVVEKQELDEKLTKLLAFINTNPMFQTLPDIERSLLVCQSHTMKDYSTILGQCISLFPPG